jgi:hypothetical protein
MLPHVGGNWNNGANAGVFSVNLNNNYLLQLLFALCPD